MSDKRQRARVQGSWAKQLPKPSNSQTASSLNNQPKNVNAASGTWGFGNQKTSKAFEFHKPSKPIREVPPEKVIEHLGDYEISLGPSGVSWLRLRPGFLTPEEADWMFSKLLAELPWSQKTNYRLGEAYEEPRLTCWFGELPYTYSRSTMAANTQWHPLLVALREAVEQASGCTFNSLLCNLYRDGHDSIGWHSDDEASLGPTPTIASLSLGDTRAFSLRKQPSAEDNGDYTYVERIRIPLSHGTLLLMEGATQDDWQHQVAKEYHDRGPRINLTFRTVHPEPEGHRPGTKMRFTAKNP
ncbi:alpha-ketoglutarate-dependent dioxygenase alkB homolog 3 isoform X1 [Poecilia latipinna]|uniref:Alpha-ketoglutarate-dependent dioxygenase alkB homolog 3 n=1 Tax=Poecilia latipinna TaxID=48699 RepID=A0A3B3V4Q2_9TELE|nr:PREDICTED: alpha-ketoglutarate-dependent dioxygenase alkB homolog 3 isoform X1 [Poecilia latipinna]